MELYWWTGVIETILVELCLVIFIGGTVMVEQFWRKGVG